MAFVAWSVATAAPRRPATPPPRPAAAGSAELGPLAQQYDVLEAKQASFAAAKLARRGLALSIQLTGPDSEAADVWRRRLASALVRIGDSSGALAIHKQLLAAAEKRHGPESAGVLGAIVELRVAYPDDARYDEREALMQRELALTAKLHGERSIAYADALSTYAGLLASHGEYAAQVLVLEHGLQIHEALAGDAGTLVRAIGALANACWWADQRPRAIALFDRMLALSGALTDTPDAPLKSRADTLWSVVGTYRQGGRDDLARPLAARATELYQAEMARLQREHPDGNELLFLLGYLSSAYHQGGDLVNADAMTEQVYALASKRGDTSVWGGPMADLRRRQGKPREALALLERAQADARRTGPQLAMLYSAPIADVLGELGDYPRAERVRAEYRASIEHSYGRRSTPYAIAELADVDLYVALGKPERAAQAMADAFDVFERDLQRTLQIGTQVDHALSVSGDGYQLDLAINFALHTAPRSASAARLGLTTLLRRKGRSLDAIAADLGAIRARLSPGDRQLLDELASARAQLAHLTVVRPAATGEAELAADIAGYEGQIQKLEVQLAGKTTAYRTAGQPIALAAVQNAVPRDARLVEIASFQPYDPKARRAPGQPLAPRHYAAFVVGKTGDPALIDLGPAPVIDDAVEQFRKAVADPDNDRARELGHALFALTMAKIAPSLGGATTVLLAPDGALDVVPFAALVDDRGDFLVQRFTFTYLTSGRDLLRLGHAIRPRSGGVVFADPSFDAAAPHAPHAPHAPPAPAEAGARGKRSPDLAGQTWQRLPGTAQEADAIVRQLRGLTVFRGPNATETALKAVHGPKILHLATHGFFLRDVPAPPADPASPAAAGTISGTPAAGGARDNPLLRSGLVLAGANQLASGDDDGILTAMEASGLDLWGTQLVVLSACETGVGKVTNGEGVYGLRRALVIAGAESLVMSLWQVDDDATRDLMAGFYARLAAGKPRSSALRDIQRELLARPRYAHPFYWASFLPAGDNTPIR